ncbi:putative glucose-6-phosphate 1-epimerase [Porphyridium purpureum]|uniref:glucose-6-phosphate 1-epimerase n=1 Tax=Porphyridium purpureum TaxID=35688 RepID=A0A5J4YIV3_PORPP|nr:putative glucose-6-phosphate 1-epimerase [Porphyridium purpureum]|eukprot:POR4695..scf289_17
MAVAFVPSGSAGARRGRVRCGNDAVCVRRASRVTLGSRLARRSVVTALALRDGDGDDGGDAYDDIAKSLAQEFGVQTDADRGAGDLAGGVGSGYAAGAVLAGVPLPVVDDVVVVGTGKNGMQTVTLDHAASSQKVTLYTFGATLTSWTTRGGSVEVFFLSDVAVFDAQKPIRGGIPICFPQFGPGPEMRQHGFCRDSQWKIKERSVMPDGSVACVLGLSSADKLESFGGWADDKAFELEYSVILSYAGLETSLRVRNTGAAPFSFTSAFHNYFRVSDVSQARIYGLENTSFVDKLNNNEEGVRGDDGGAGVSIEEPTDRMHFATPDELAMFDFQNLRLLKLKKTPTLPDATVWNPYGADGCDPGWRSFVCVEPAALKPVTIEPAAEWLGGQLLAVD